MAEATFSVDQFSCSVCLDLLKDPVSIPCGHSYCMSCITNCWDQDDQKGIYSCPQCRQTFNTRPALCKTTMLAQVVEKLKTTKRKSASCFAGPGDVECDICTGRKRKAVKSCLMCLESYCHTHFERHEEFRPGKRHQTIDATGRLHEIFCRQHNKVLEVFCRTDEECICMLCMMDKHKNHDTVLVSAQRKEKEMCLKGAKIDIQQRIQQRLKDVHMLKLAVKSYKCSTQTAVEDCEKMFTELIRSIERSRSEVTQLIRDQEKDAVSQAEGLLKQLQQEIADLKRRNTDLEKLSYTDNDIHFLQSLSSLSVPPKSTDKINISFLVSFDDMRESVHQLRQKLQDFCQEETKEITVTYNTIVSRFRKQFLPYSLQLTPDLNAMNKHLSLCEGNRKITFTGTAQQYPDHPDRFDFYLQVLCKEIVCGRCYWELEWSGKNGVCISVSYKSISRKGGGDECRFGYNDQSWCLLCTSTGYSFWHNNRNTHLPVKCTSSRIGVYVDYSAGSLSFYSVSDTMTLIHSVQTTFTQPLYPGFYIGHKSLVKLCDLSV
ncbi:tripartite motif-containing protein 16 isoform X1 [Misgurnus anguillicaudatus]|uniref:tripartite motif-containing protein 16 isoform X1 n=1 Tax=Misgurnus anguillicaudatus TaxID=75329 RepID=UPI003CCFC2C5